MSIASEILQGLTSNGDEILYALTSSAAEILHGMASNDAENLQGLTSNAAEILHAVAFTQCCRNCAGKNILC